MTTDQSDILFGNYIDPKDLVAPPKRPERPLNALEERMEVLKTRIDNLKDAIRENE